MRQTLGFAFAAACAVALSIVGGNLAAQAPAAGAQQPPAGQQPAAGQPQEGRGQGRGQGRGGGGGAQPLNLDDHTGFQSIFDGTMKNWEGDPALWKAEGGAIVGTTTAENPLKENTFVIWRGGEPADFELQVDFRMSSTNSGIQFRSAHLPPGGEGRGAIVGKWVLKGYQADIDFDNQFTGMIYEERGRAFLARRGTWGEGGASTAVDMATPLTP